MRMFVPGGQTPFMVAAVFLVRDVFADHNAGIGRFAKIHYFEKYLRVQFVSQHHLRQYHSHK